MCMKARPRPITAYFATAAKVAALCLFLRAILIAVPRPDRISGARSSSSSRCCRMALGAIAAIGQNNIKRLMAYSSIGHMGYALLGLAAGTALGARGVLIYLAIYVFTNLGVFACIQAMRRGGKAVENISDLAGLARTDPKLARGLRHAVPQPGGPAAAGRLLRQILCLPRRHPGGADRARRAGRARQRHRPGLLPAPGEDDVFDEPARGVRRRHRHRLARDPGPVGRWWRCSSSSPPRR